MFKRYILLIAEGSTLDSKVDMSLIRLLNGLVSINKPNPNYTRFSCRKIPIRNTIGHA